MSRKSKKQLEEFRDSILDILNTFQTELSKELSEKLINMDEADQEEAMFQMKTVKTAIDVLICGLNKEMLDMIIEGIINKKKGGR